MGVGVHRTLRIGTALTMLVIGLTGVLQSTHAAASATTLDPISVAEPAVTLDGDSAVIDFVNETGVDLTVSGKLAGTDAVVISEPNPVPAGQSATLAVSVGEPSDLTTDDRFVIIVAPTAGLPDGWTTRLPFVDADAKSPAQPAVDTWRTISYSGWSLWFDDERDIEIPLQNTGPCDTVDLPDDTAVGWLGADGRAIEITASCKPLTDGSLVAVLDVGQAGPIGRDYTGAIDLAAGNPSTGNVALTARRTMHPVTFGLLLAAGILIALLIKWWTTSGKAVAEQVDRVARLQYSVIGARPENPLEQFGRITRKEGLTPVSRWDLETAVDTELAEIAEKLRSIVRPWKPGATSTETYRSSIERVDVIEGAIVKWPNVAKSLVRLHALSANLASLPAVRASVLAATLERPTMRVTVDDVARISIDVRRGIEVATSWPHDRYLQAAELFDTLADMTDDNDEQFETAKAAATASWAEFTAKQADTINDDDEINNTKALLYEALRRAEFAKQLHDEPGFDIFKSDAASAPAARVGAATTGPTIQPQVTSTRLIRAAQWTFDRLILAAVLLVSVIAGTKTLYIDQAVGGRWDTLVIVTWGFATAAVAGPISAAIQSVSDGLSRESTPAGS